MSMGGGSFSSDQTTLHRTGATTGVNLRTGRTRVTSIQAAGAGSSEVSLYDQTAAVIVAGNLKAKYLFDVDGLEVYVPGSGILFKDGVTIVVVASAGATLTITGA
jgi:hypothetical protein